LLFESDFLYKTLANPALREKQVQNLRDFFTSTINNFVQLEDYSSAALLVWAASVVQRYLDHTSVKREVPLVQPQLVLALIENSASDKFISQQPMIYQALFCSLHPLLQKMPQTEDEQKLFAYFLLLEPLRKQRSKDYQPLSIFANDHNRACLTLRQFVEE